MSHGDAVDRHRADGPRPSLTARAALRTLQVGVIAVVLVSAPYKSFDLDRFFVPKELVLNLTALAVSLLCLARVKRLSLSRTDQLIALWLALGAASALFATNWWLGSRAFAVSLSGAACFWCARWLSRQGYSRALVGALALAGVLGAITALLQTYGLRTELFSLNRAPGGTFGNRNFMAHLAVITLPALFFAGLRASSRASLLRWCGGAALVAASLVLSRSRAAWLALAAGLVVLLIAAVIALRQRDGLLKLARLFLMVAAAAAGGAAALVVPNTLDWRSDSPYRDTAHGLVNFKKGSGHGRLIQYGTSARMSLRHPLLGVGPGNWAVEYPSFAADNDPSLAQDGMTSNPWPSSDWIAFLSERGAIALGALLLALVALGTDGVRGLFARERSEDRLAAAVLLSTGVILVTVGMFDAVLLLPAPALVGWSLLGALAPDARERKTIALSGPRRLLLAIGVAAVGALAVTRSASQLLAMSTYSGAARVSTFARASVLDPGSFRIQMRVAELYLRRGDCRRAASHASAAQRLFPNAAAPRRILSACGS